MANLTLTEEEYEALAFLATEGTKDAAGQIIHDKALRLDTFLKAIEVKNGITRHSVWVQWQELDEPLPAGTRFPGAWPPSMRALIQRTDRAIAKSDIETLVAQRARKPLSVMFTKDPGATYGWMSIDDYT